MSLSRIFHVLASALLVLTGCQQIRPTTPVVLPDGVVAPLSEAEFDAFEFRIAAQLTQAMAAEGVPTPARLRIPTIAPGETPATPRMRLFCHTLAEGLADRMGGRVSVEEVTGREPDLRATITWPPPDAAERTIAISIVDQRSGKLLVAEHAGIAPPPAAGTDAARAGQAASKPAAPIKPIDIEMQSSEIGPFVAARLDEYAGQSSVGDDGRVIFLDDDHERYFMLESQQAKRADGAMGTEVRIRTVRGAEDLRYRVLFYDDDDQPLGVTPVTPRAIARDATIVLRALSRDSRAAKYVYLIERD